MIKYPNNKKVNIKGNNNNISNNLTLNISYNKGMSFEEEINKANTFYLNQDIACIHKKPTPIKILKTKNYTYNFQKKVEIEKAVFEKKSTTDYNGIYKGYYIDFEAKETKYKSFNVGSNLHTHQREHLIKISKLGGIGFLIVNFTYYNKVFIISIEDLDVKESILPFSYFEKNGFEIDQTKTLYLDYLKSVDRLILKKEYYGKEEN